MMIRLMSNKVVPIVVSRGILSSNSRFLQRGYRQVIRSISSVDTTQSPPVIAGPASTVPSSTWKPQVSRDVSEQFSTTTSDSEKKTQCKKWFEIVQYGTPEELKETIEEGGVDVNCRNEEDKTLLIIAAELGKVDIMKVLIANGANINLQDKFGDTALIAASRENCKNAIKLLVEAGAQADVKNYEEMTAADSTQDVEIDETLREKEGHVVETHPNDGCCPR